VFGPVVPLPPRPGSDVLHRLRTSGHPAAARVVHEMCKVHGSWELENGGFRQGVTSYWEDGNNKKINQSITMYDVLCHFFFA